MKNKGSTTILVITVMLFAVALTMACLALFIKMSGYEITKKEAAPPVAEEEDYALSKIEEIDSLISQSYLKEYDREFQMEGVYRSMLDSLDDPYSRYMNAEELKQLQQGLNNTFTGTGIVFIDRDEDGEDGYMITEVIQGGPASVAGILEGDLILSVDGKTYDTSEELIEALKGNPGSKVDITILRDEEEMTFSVIRGDVTGASVDSRTLSEENLGYIKIRSFGTDTYGLFETAISGFEKGNVDGVIIDLRDNPGGLFDEGVKVADRILPESLVAYTVNKAGERENYNSDSIKTNLKIAVLVNENTASTAEMVALSIKNADAGVLVGTTTYGKGLIQETHVYDDGSAVNLTTNEFFCDGDTKIDGVGVTPDKTVSNPASGHEDLQLEEAIKAIKG